MSVAAVASIEYLLHWHRLVASVSPKAEAVVMAAFVAAERDVVRRMCFVLPYLLYRWVLSFPELVQWMNCCEGMPGSVAHDTLHNVAKGRVVLVMYCHNS